MSALDELSTCELFAREGKVQSELAELDARRDALKSELKAVTSALERRALKRLRREREYERLRLERARANEPDPDTPLERANAAANAAFDAALEAAEAAETASILVETAETEAPPEDATDEPCQPPRTPSPMEYAEPDESGSEVSVITIHDNGAPPWSARRTLSSSGSNNSSSSGSSVVSCAETLPAMAEAPPAETRRVAVKNAACARCGFTYFDGHHCLWEQLADP